MHVSVHISKGFWPPQSEAIIEARGTWFFQQIAALLSTCFHEDNSPLRALEEIFRQLRLEGHLLPAAWLRRGSGSSQESPSREGEAFSAPCCSSSSAWWCCQCERCSVITTGSGATTDDSSVSSIHNGGVSSTHNSGVSSTHNGGVSSTHHSTRSIVGAYATSGSATTTGAGGTYTGCGATTTGTGSPKPNDTWTPPAWAGSGSRARLTRPRKVPTPKARRTGLRHFIVPSSFSGVIRVDGLPGTCLLHGPHEHPGMTDPRWSLDAPTVDMGDHILL